MSSDFPTHTRKRMQSRLLARWRPAKQSFAAFLDLHFSIKHPGASSLNILFLFKANEIFVVDKNDVEEYHTNVPQTGISRNIT